MPETLSEHLPKLFAGDADIAKAQCLSPFMAAIRLLAASVDTSSTSGVNADCTALVPAIRLATQRNAANNIASQNDDFVWSASAGDDGTFNFYGAQRNAGNNTVSARSDGFQSSQISGSDWYMRNAVFQYNLHSSMPMASQGQLLSVYA